jgi:hypothetical protein
MYVIYMCICVYERACGCIASMYAYVRLRVPTMRPRTSRVCVYTSAGIYSRSAHAIYIHVYIYIDVNPLRCHVYTFIYMIHACICIHAPSYMDERIARCVPAPHTRPRVRPCSRSRLCVWAHTHSRRNVRAPSAGVDRGSARRCSPMRRRSTRTSARGTPRRSAYCRGYAPLSVRGAPPRRRRSAGVRCGVGRCARPHHRCARTCAQTYGNSHARASSGVCIAAGRKDGMHVRIHTHTHTHTHTRTRMCVCTHTNTYVCVYTHIYVCVCVCIK